MRKKYRILGVLPPRPRARAYDGSERAWWQGVSGNWYIHTVYSLTDLPAFRGYSFVLVQRDESGHCTPLYFGQVGACDGPLSKHRKFWPAQVLGANEVHIHLLGGDAYRRSQTSVDLAKAHDTPLNRHRLEIRR